MTCHIKGLSWCTVFLIMTGTTTLTVYWNIMVGLGWSIGLLTLQMVHALYYFVDIGVYNIMLLRPI